MKIQNLNIIGLMSGTSLDGVDLAYVSFEYSNELVLHIHAWEIAQAETIPYSNEILQKLKEAVNYNGYQLTEFDRELGKEYGNMIKDFCREKKLKPDLIASHGHTIFHSPQKGFTLQIGYPASIVGQTGYPVIGDFRSTDIALVGQGAPLAPIVDRYLFNNYNVCINLGGIVNLTIQSENESIAFDVCPGNQLLNYLAESLGKTYDDGGKIARSGKLNLQLFNTLKSWPYFNRSFPKSLDNNDIKDSFIPLLESIDCSIEDKMHTVVILVAKLIKESLSRLSGKGNPSVLVTGGGAHNSYLIEVIRNELSEFNITVPDIKTIDFKEALLMALLGLLRYNNNVNVISSVTGSKADHCAGAIYLGTQNRI